jgi:hypothetical protein
VTPLFFGFAGQWRSGAPCWGERAAIQSREKSGKKHSSRRRPARSEAERGRKSFRAPGFISRPLPPQNNADAFVSTRKAAKSLEHTAVARFV